MSRVDPPGRKKTVLFVNDDAGLQGSFRELLAGDGYTVDLAPSGPIAFECLRRDSYAVILLDLTLPQMNGVGFLEQLERESPSLLRRVVLLAGPGQRLMESINTNRLWAVMRKPFDQADLLRVMRECSSGVRPGRRAGLQSESGASARV